MRAWPWRHARQKRHPSSRRCQTPSSTSLRCYWSGCVGCARPATSTRRESCWPVPTRRGARPGRTASPIGARPARSRARRGRLCGECTARPTKGATFADAEFFAGWVALRFLKRTDEALKHFQTLYDGVGTDISRSRAAYWLGRALDAGGHAKDAAAWFDRAAAFGQTFYGQLAARRTPGTAARLPADPPTTAAERQALDGRELVMMARALGQAGDFDRTRPFLLRVARMVEGPARPRCWPSSRSI